MNDFIICPLCGKQVKRLKRHLRMAKEHKDLDVDEWLLQNPNIKTISDTERQRYIDTQKEYCLTDRGKKQLSDMGKRAWSNEESRSKLLEGRRKQHETVEYRALHSKVARQVMLSKMADPVFYEKAMKNIRSYGKRFLFELDDGNVIHLRSELELGIATYLKEHNLTFRYEKDPVLYLGDDNKYHSYYIDFYVPSLDLAIEGKPKQLWNREDTQIKLQVAKKHFKYVMLVAYDLTDLDSFIGSVTTTESISKEKDFRE